MTRLSDNLYIGCCPYRTLPVVFDGPKGSLSDNTFIVARNNPPKLGIGTALEPETGEDHCGSGEGKDFTNHFFGLTKGIGIGG